MNIYTNFSSEFNSIAFSINRIHLATFPMDSLCLLLTKVYIHPLLFGQFNFMHRLANLRSLQSIQIVAICVFRFHSPFVLVYLHLAVCLSFRCFSRTAFPLCFALLFLISLARIEFVCGEAHDPSLCFLLFICTSSLFCVECIYLR